MQSHQNSLNNKHNAEQRTHSLKSVPIMRYKHNNQFVENSSHPVLRVRKRKSKYYLKLTNGSKISEIEALAAAYYRLLMGYDGVPRVKSVHHDNERIGVISKRIDGFRPAHAEIGPFRRRDNWLIQTGIAKLLVTSYVLEECDLHEDNWGFNKDDKAVRIDFDWSFWPLSYKYVYDKYKFSLHMTERDILSFPNLKDASPAQWFRYVIPSPKFISDKWKYFLKSILIHDNPVIRNISNAYLASTSAQERYFNHLNNRLGELKSLLTQIPPFQDYLAEHPKVLSMLQSEFDEYNSAIKEKDSELRINLQEIEKSFNSLIDDVKEKEAYKNRLAFIRARNALQQRINAIPVKSPIRHQAEIVLRGVEQADEMKHCDKVGELTIVLEKTSDLLQLTHPVSMDSKAKISDYTALSNSVSGSPSFAWQMLGVAMAILGVTICALCTIVAATTLIPTFGLGTAACIAIAPAGAALMLAGIGLFAYNSRRGLSSDMHAFIGTVKEQLSPGI